MRLAALEASLRERERELEEAHRIARLGTWRWIKATDDLTWSPEVYRLYGCDPALPPPRHDAVRKLMTPESFEQISAAIQHLFATGEPYQLDLQITHVSGEPRWALARGEVAARGPDGDVPVIRGTVQDITERKLREQQLALSEARYRSLVRVSSEIVWTTDPVGAQLFDVPEWRAFTGQTPAEILGFGYAEAVHPDDREPSLAAWNQAVLDGANFQVQQRLRRHDGVYRIMQVRAVPSRDAQGNIVEWIGMHEDVTEQVEAETAARQANERLQSVLTGMTDGLAIRDREGRYTYFSERAAQILGVERETILGRDVWEVFPGARETESYEQTQLALATGRPAHFDSFTGPPVNKWLENHYYPTEDGIAIYFRDITEKKQSEAALRDSQSRFQKLYDANLMGICYPDKFGAFSDGNDEFLRIVGYTREEVAAGLVRWDTMTPPEYAELDAQHIAEAAQRGSCTPYQKEYIRKDGTRVPILCGYALLEGSDQNYIGFITDLSAQKQVEQALLDREKRFRELAESLPQMVWEAGPDTRITYVNRRWLEYTGLGLEEMSGSVARELVHPEDIERTEQMRLRSLQTGQPYAAQVRMRRDDGVYREFLARAVPVFNERHEVERWIGTLTDIHDQHLAEEALRRTEKLAATGRLAASIAHEINNPLEAVTNALYLALQMDLSEEVREYLKLADQELTRVAQVTTQTLRFHRQSTAAVSCNVAEVLDSALSLYLSRLRAAGIEVQRDYRSHVPLLCYPDELRQVFANLIGNAMDATRSGGRIVLRVRAAPAFDGVRVTIADTGHGIPADLRGRVFEAFLSTKQDTGTGLGLWVSEGIIRKHRGRIALRSRTAAPSGTVFSILLPQNAASRLSPGAEPQASPSGPPIYHKL